MNILRQELAPISDKAWKELFSQAKDAFSNYLTARRLVDVKEPKGLDFGVINTGRLKKLDEKSNENTVCSIFDVQPLIELKTYFKLDRQEIDSIDRGCKNPDLAPLIEAARVISKLEDEIVYYGMKKANVDGLKKNVSDTITLSLDAESLLKSIVDAKGKLVYLGIGGPYSLVVSPEVWKFIVSHGKGYPLLKSVKNTIDGKIVVSPHIKDVFFLSERGGDFILNFGQDLSIGYDSHNDKHISLYFLETLTFQVFENAAVCLELK
ncbi:MAG: family 1 encapsulin nanocompartment shell protein [Deferribacterota bacterium]|nr:family 1 encapsulin nanocompartment shell protein [Deferribacterota bacterium]